MPDSKVVNYDALVSEAVTVGIRHIGIAVYSSGKILKYLMNKGYSFDIASEAVKSIIARGYIDDYRAGNKIITTRINKKQESKRMLYQRLVNDGISSVVAEDMIKDLQDDRITCRILIESLLSDSSDIDENRVHQIVKKAYQRGYSPDLASSVIRECIN